MKYAAQLRILYPRPPNVSFDSARSRDEKIRAAITMSEFDECAAEFGMTFKAVYQRHLELVGRLPWIVRREP